MITKIFATVFKTMILLIIAALLTPIAYFAYPDPTYDPA